MWCLWNMVWHRHAMMMLPRATPQQPSSIATPQRRSSVAARDQRGSGTVLTAAAMMGVIVTTLIALVVIGWVGSSRKARSAADLASLAGAYAIAAGKDACPAAERSAVSNGGTLEACSVQRNGTDFVVSVQVSVPVTPNLPGGPKRTRADATAGSVPYP